MRIISNCDFSRVFVKKKADLFIIDPPYGGIINESYDKIKPNDLVDLLIKVMLWTEKCAFTGASAYVFGGTGKFKKRPFLQFALDVEHKTKWRIHNWITWKKRRGYGTQKNWIYAREEMLFLTFDDKKPVYFNVPYTNEIRSDEWEKRLKNKKYKPKNARLRYSNVIADINEIFSGHLVKAQKPERLYQLLIQTSCHENGMVIDPMCGSGTTAAVIEKNFPFMDYLCIEKSTDVYNIAIDRIKKINPLWSNYQLRRDKNIDTKSSS